MKASVLVTGASSGLGAEIAREYSNHGYYVFLLGRSEEKLKQVQTTCKGSVEILAFDLKDIAHHEKTILERLQGKPTLEVLVNNAGIYSRNEFSNTTDAEWIEQIEINLMAPVRLTRLIWPHFVKNKKGSILNISSTLGVKPVPATSAYSATKAAMNNWTLTLAQEGGAHNIRANAICPGIIDTPIHAFHNLPENQKKEVADKLSELQLLKPLGTPKDIARAAYFLGSDESAWTTGALLHVDGGVNIK